MGPIHNWSMLLTFSPVDGPFSLDYHFTRSFSLNRPAQIRVTVCRRLTGIPITWTSALFLSLHLSVSRTTVWMRDRQRRLSFYECMKHRSNSHSVETKFIQFFSFYFISWIMKLEEIEKEFVYLCDLFCYSSYFIPLIAIRRDRRTALATSVRCLVRSFGQLMYPWFVALHVQRTYLFSYFLLLNLGFLMSWLDICFDLFPNHYSIDSDDWTYCSDRCSLSMTLSQVQFLFFAEIRWIETSLKSKCAWKWIHSSLLTFALHSWLWSRWQVVWNRCECEIQLGGREKNEVKSLSCLLLEERVRGRNMRKSGEKRSQKNSEKDAVKGRTDEWERLVSTKTDAKRRREGLGAESDFSLLLLQLMRRMRGEHFSRTRLWEEESSSPFTFHYFPNIGS